jgi:hypothetical protein
VDTGEGKRGILVTNLLPAERDSRDQLEGIQLNNLLVSYYCSGSVGSATYSWKGIRRAWLSVQVRRLGERKREQ